MKSNRKKDLGMETIRQAARVMKHSEWSYEEGRTISRWAAKLKQEFWADTPRSDCGLLVSQVGVETIIAQEVPDCALTYESVSALNQSATLSALVYDPESRQLSYRSTGYLHKQTAPWFREIFPAVAGMQICEAEQELEKDLPRRFDGDPVLSSHPGRGARLDCDPLLEMLDWMATNGEGDSPFTLEDFGDLERLQFRFGLIVVPGEEVISIAASLPSCSHALVMGSVSMAMRHPRLGVGCQFEVLLVGLPSSAQLANQLNLVQASTWCRCPLWGAWHMSSPNALGFSAFIPAALHLPGLATNLLLHYIATARWGAEQLQAKK